MAVRRLHPEQPATFRFSDENVKWAQTIIAKYPEGRQAAAVIPLLWRAQEQEGWVTEPAIRAVADLLGMDYIRVYEIATFYTMFQLAPVGRKAHVQVCGTTPCMLRGSEGLMSLCRERIAEHQHEVSSDGALSWEEVECIGCCANAPVVQIGKDTYEDLTPKQLEKILDALVRDKPTPLPGSQTGRKASCPTGGATTLTEGSLYDGSRSGAWMRRFPELAGQAPRAALASAAAVSGGSEVAAAKSAPPSAPAAAPINTAAAALAANAGLVPELERRSTGKALGSGEIEILKSASSDPGVGTGYVAADVVIGDESAGDVEKPPTLKAPRGGRRDDLKLIWGIGPKLEEALNKLGIYHFTQIASWSVRNTKWIDQELEDFRGRAERDRWIEQARKLASGWRPAKDAGDKPQG